MQRVAIAVFVGCVLGSFVVRADVWDAFEHGGGDMTIVESSVLIHVPWGPPILHELSGEPAGCGFKPVDESFLELDSQMFGLSGRLRYDLRRLGLSRDYPVWGRIDRLEQCIDVGGQQITVEATSFIINGHLSELPAPVAQRCGGDPATLRIELTDAVPPSGWDPRPGSLEVPFSYGCGPDRVPSGQTLLLTDFQATVLARGGEPSEPESLSVSVEGPVTCQEPSFGSHFGTDVVVRVTVDPPPAPEAFLFDFYSDEPGREGLRHRSWINPWHREVRIGWGADPDFTGEFRVYVEAVETRPDGTRLSAETTVTVLPTSDPACPLGRFALDPEYWEPRWDGCWACDFSINRFRDPLIINERLVLGATTRLRNGVTARDLPGMVASVSESPAGVRTSFIMLGDKVLHELQGIELRGLNALGMGIGARVDPKKQVRSAVWFDGQNVKDLGTLGGSSSEAAAISEAGWLVGWAEDAKGARRAFISREGKMEALALPEHFESEATGIGGDRWVSGTLLTEKGSQGFLFDVGSGDVHLAALPEEGASIELHAVNVWGRAAGTLTTHNQQVVPVVFSVEDGLVRLETLGRFPDGFIPTSTRGIASDGSVFVSGLLNGEEAHLRFSP